MILWWLPWSYDDCQDLVMVVTSSPQQQFLTAVQSAPQASHQLSQFNFMSPPQLLPHCWIERVEVTMCPVFFDCLFATIPPLYVSSISEIPHSLVESNFRELNISTLAYLCLELNPESHNINFFGNSWKTSNRLTHFCRSKKLSSQTWFLCFVMSEKSSM